MIEIAQQWHGFKRGERALHVGRLPRRKSLVLYMVEGNVATPLGYFPDEESAHACLDLLDELILGGAT